jgi:CO/xanthine dehydrogenase Mo-binding subunit
MAGNAARIGVQELLKRIRPVAAQILDCPEPSLIFKDNRICTTVESTRALGFGDLTAECFRRGISLFAHGWYKAPSTTWDEHTGQGEAYFTYVYGANLAEVEVDTVTGQVNVTKFISSHDIGRTLNLNGAKGQVYGGIAMGLGYALLEEYSEENGLPTLENFDEYLLPTICDVPDINIIFIENPDSLGPFGAKSLGEPASELAAPAIVNAVANAIGIRVRDLPLTLERVLLGKNLARSDKRGSVKSRSAHQ